jgi:hypothetical protein
MDTHPNGVPLDSVNAVSATTTGAFDIFMATIHRHCSPLLMSTLVISLLITATSSIAPAACELFPLNSRKILTSIVLSVSAGSTLIDMHNSTLWIGALPNDIDTYGGYAVNTLVAKNTHFQDNWQNGLHGPHAPGIGFNYGLG